MNRQRFLLLPVGLALTLGAAAALASPQPSPSQQAGPFKVLFVLDMREEITARRFDPGKDAVGVRSGVEPLTWHATLVIIVGVANTAARTDEYTPTRVEERGPDGSVVWSGGGKGTAEADHAVPAARRLRDTLIAKGWVLGSDLAYLEQDGGGHDEIAWASRVEPMLRFL